MAWTLTEAQKMSNTVLLKGIIQTIVTESDVLKFLPFRPVVGNSLTYNQETTQPTADFFASGDTWNESTGTRTQQTAALKILGGDADMDEFERVTLSDQNDLEAVLLEEKAKAVAYVFDKKFIYGDASVASKEFSGLHKLVSTASPAMVIDQGSGTTGAAMSLYNLDKTVDLVKPGRPDALVMNKTIRRRLRNFYRSTSTYSFRMEVGEDGKPMEYYGDIPILLDDFILQTETIASGTYSSSTGGLSSSVFAMKFGVADLCGLQNGSIQTVRVGMLESKDATRWRLRWYCGVALFSTLSLARLDGCTDAAVVA